MPLPITVPRLGWSMDQGTFVGWLKQDGDLIKAGEPLFTLENDKAAQEVEATDSGILRILPEAPKAGDTVSVGAVLGYLVGANEVFPPTEGLPSGEPGRAHAPASAGPQKPATASELSGALNKPAVAAAEESRTSAPAGAVSTLPKFAASPRARRRAAELGLDYRRLKGSGRTGRIIEADVLAAARAIPRIGLSAMRRTIAQRTEDSWSKVPHFYLRTEVDATALLELRERMLPEIESAAGKRITLTDFLLRAQAMALRDCPHANAIWQHGEIVRLPGHDVGLVVGVAEGLLMAIVRGADTGGLAALVQQRASLVEAARAGTLAAEAMQGGATSLSNLGNTRVDEFAAVIAPPQSSMLAVGRAAPRPFVVGGQVVARNTLKLCLSVDHRVMDGGPAAEFLGRIASLLEHPSELAGELRPAM